MSVDFDVKGHWGSIIVNYRWIFIAGSDGSWLNRFFLKQHFASQKVNWWTGVM